tara:strand:+ start:166 stop:534 length:369 start_codon:yes stop_codon:yes gene_type:complete
MVRINVVGEAYTGHEFPAELHGITCQERFCDYIKDNFDTLRGGYMDFRYEDGKLLTYTVYDSDRKLTEKEEQILIDYTQGQWSDGIGEGFEQIPCAYDDDGRAIYVSAWRRGQEAVIKYENI